MSYGTGYKPDSPAIKARNQILGARTLRARLARAASLPPSVSLVNKCPPVFDQGQTGGCTSCAFAAAAYVASAQKTQLPFVPSQKGIYVIERALERAAAGQSYPATLLTDSGAMPADGITVLSSWGLEPMGGPTSDGRYSDLEVATLNDELSLTDLEADGQQITITGHPITSSGADFVTDLRTALASGCPVTFSVPGGSDAFQEYTGGILGPIAGVQNDHYIGLYGAETQADGSIVWTARNSWGADFGEAGYMRFSTAFLEQNGGDFYAIESR